MKIPPNTDEPIVDDQTAAAPAAEPEAEAPATRTVDDIPDEEWTAATLTNPAGAQHKVKWVPWGESEIVVRPTSYVGPDMVVADLDEAAKMVPQPNR